MLWTTAGLLVLVGAGSIVLGTGLAWLTTAYDFPGRRTLTWALMLPLAMPAYILGFVFLALFDFAGPVQGVLRSIFGGDVWFPDVTSVSLEQY
jgi:iron(III) transport system permease protein